MPPAHPETKIGDQRTYRLRLVGSVDEDFFRTICPAGSAFQQEGELFTLSNIQTDQSGILGLVRGLHNLGCIIIELSII
ncbi:MAG TPA: hypothetical protein PKW33_11695 [Anaerolineaceae bacterium]|nr:hypothetical protein [Anaerolineaceae bacterium]HPN52242.1 hypothetical protein [Anaerolineaceae bacterium]